ncbi:M48 family metallopeptidase [Pedobacter sp. SYP-B3415]|uniref:M48 family metallopeptidase n=1 Tax=Pedobacter sp. SYP-B3415 TaxID=2496641 RepID=UPI00101D5135|nr:M48 family metallopeptidase [Pedobacter sp. SYP-B3415]
MYHPVPPISKEFRMAGIWSVGSVLLFLVSYVILISMLLLLIAGAVYGATLLIAWYTSWPTIALFVVVMVMTALVLIFLFKFVAKEHVTDLSHLIEIVEADQPALFELIRQTTNEVGTKFPRRVYLGSDVNAAVFYDSSFWSMFFPVRKNLQIGVGLMNSTTLSEFKAILAHEFGHFSQRSMKVGSYVYHSNRVMHDMLFDDESYRDMAERWASIHGYVYAGVRLAQGLVASIRWVLRKIYQVLNVNYYKLSREMEFHADAVAASITGAEPMINALLRMGLSVHALDKVQEFYQNQTGGASIPTNIYAGQRFVMTHLAGELQVPLQGGLPQITEIDMGRFDKSKLVLTDQWASHPSTRDRVDRLRLLMMTAASVDHQPANTLLQDCAAVELKLTQHLYRELEINGALESCDSAEFERRFVDSWQQYRLPELYRGYFDSRDPYVYKNPQDFNDQTETFSGADQVFSDERIEDLKTLEALNSDLIILGQIQRGEIDVPSFDYDDKRYQKADSPAVIEVLEAAQSGLEHQFGRLDKQICYFFYKLAENSGQAGLFEQRYQAYAAASETARNYHNDYLAIVGGAAYMMRRLPYDDIINSTEALKKMEPRFKKTVEAMCADPAFARCMTEEQLELLQKYLSKDWTYFDKDMYHDSQVDLLYAAINIIFAVNNQALFYAKKDLLSYQAELASAQPVYGAKADEQAEFAVE